MARSINQVILMGNLTRDPEARTTQSGKNVSSFSIAVNRGEEVDFFDITAWEKTAELVNAYLQKGSRVIIQGRLTQNQWEDKEGNKRSKVEVIANDVTFLDPKREQDSQEIGDEQIDLSKIPF